jgi:hypothetical protein
LRIKSEFKRKQNTIGKSILISKILTFNFLLFTFYLILSSPLSYAQKKEKKEKPIKVSLPTFKLVYDDINYRSEIKSVAFYNKKNEQSFPIYYLNSQEQLVLKFDDLRSGNRNLYYSIEHCDANWQPSSLSPLEYLEGFSQDRINNYRISYNTLKPYTHYEILLPNLAVIPKLSGNYLLKVYEDGDANQLLLSRRFYVVNTKVDLQAEIIASRNINNRSSKQKINFSVYHPNLIIQNPFLDISAVVLQNGRTDLLKKTTKPLYIRNQQLIYTDDNTNEFEGGNEFKRIDTRSLRFRTESVSSIVKDSLFKVYLFKNSNLKSKKYAYQFDENGNFFVINQDGGNNDYDADYAEVNFTLDANIIPEGNGFAYVVGKFNAYQKNDQSRMVFDPSEKSYKLMIPIKQGITDYHYTWADENGKTIDDTAFGGSFFETENDYQILIYYRSPNNRYDEIIAFTALNTATKIRNY